MTMINKGVGIRKPLRRYQLFGIQGAIGLAEYHMPFAGDLAECIIMGHRLITKFTGFTGELGRERAAGSR